MYVVIYCSFIFSVCIFIFYFSSEILAKFSYSVNPRLNKVYVCMYACMHACMHACMYVCMYLEKVVVMPLYFCLHLDSSWSRKCKIVHHALAFIF